MIQNTSLGSEIVISSFVFDSRGVFARCNFLMSCVSLLHNHFISSLASKHRIDVHRDYRKSLNACMEEP